VRFEFDPAKDKSNEALVWVDDRYGYDEQRMVALAPLGDRLYYVAFVERANVRRIISLRYAERREIKHYVENLP
jgi:uncharacterized DUF497 family protein